MWETTGGPENPEKQLWFCSEHWIHSDKRQRDGLWSGTGSPPSLPAGLTLLLGILVNLTDAHPSDMRCT